MLSKREPKTNHRAHSMVTLSSPRRRLLRPLFLRRLPLHHLLLRPALLERGHKQLPNDPRFLGRGILDIFCSLPNGTPHYALSSFLAWTRPCLLTGDRSGLRSANRS